MNYLAFDWLIPFMIRLNIFKALIKMTLYHHISLKIEWLLALCRFEAKFFSNPSV
jgi:hypothetical protein